MLLDLVELVLDALQKKINGDGVNLDELEKTLKVPQHAVLGSAGSVVELVVGVKEEVENWLECLPNEKLLLIRVDHREGGDRQTENSLEEGDDVNGRHGWCIDMILFK